MKNLIFLTLTLLMTFSINAQGFIGAWEGTHTTDSGQEIKTVVIFSSKYQVTTQYDAKTGEFVMTNGGTWELAGDTMTETIEFDTKNPERVGTEVSFKVFIKDSIMGIVGSEQKLKRIDDGSPGKLQGAWLMSGRIRNGKTQQRDTNRPRKTMKILSGSRFQWIAYNTETKQFMATCGGSYTTVDGKYTENLEFFSRDNAKVGLQLQFDYKLVDGKWHHSGLSSKGDPIYEIWSQRE
ncbi:membrane or secreted protein [Spongiivirga citrea]|uniref:Membrane or secreted protein n=1 Tax=Spongiivirga citrea TaxID=1481457 RepID=A0A6M0CKC2_9FLAO|nr:membrane or secreted protein [Spongiivirga citrea]NER17443.1 membrane or secreted protein [Spongiivirga citrea]